MAAFTAQDLRNVERAPVHAGERVNPHAKELNALAETVARQSGQRLITATILEGLVRLGELGLTFVVGLSTYLVVVDPLEGLSLAPLLAVPLLSVLVIITMQSLGCYRVAALRTPTRFGLRISASWFAVFGLAFAACYLAKIAPIFDEAWLGRWCLFGFLAISAERFALASLTNFLTRTGRLSRRTVIVGGGPAAKQLLQDFAEQGTEDLHIFGIFDDRTDDRSPDVVCGYPKLGNVDDLVEFGRSNPLDLVIFTLPISAEQRLLVMLRKLWVLPVDIRLSAHMNKLRFRPRAYSYIGKVPVIDLFDKPIAEWDIVVKTIFDRLVGVFCLLALSPVMLLVALAVKLDSKGPVFFRQKRYGFNNELIEVFKFRSMYTDQLDVKANKLVTRDDPRVTRVGRFIRKSSLDELPQLFNVVFKGNLSLVGPRPHAVHAKAADALYDEVVDGYFARHRVRPGITGWAQIHGWRGETDTSEKIQKRVECDLFYIENWSIFLDLYVLFATPVSLDQNEKRLLNARSSERSKRQETRTMVQIKPVLALLFFVVTGGAQARDLQLELTGSPTVLYDSVRDACAPIDVPDINPRAFRDASGRVVMFALHFVNRPLRGPDLTHLKIDCHVALESALDPDPSHYNDRSYIAATWTSRWDKASARSFTTNTTPTSTTAAASATRSAAGSTACSRIIRAMVARRLPEPSRSWSPRLRSRRMSSRDDTAGSSIHRTSSATAAMNMFSRQRPAGTGRCPEAAFSEPATLPIPARGAPSMAPSFRFASAIPTWATRAARHAPPSSHFSCRSVRLCGTLEAVCGSLFSRRPQAAPIPSMASITP